ncbi:hypothetical protein [Candidatus Laterigemmans baculatus]|uniref:hypothetical protein n=1 Tax=Candidatus Laterigemmans baculatus TaxID=2770505 RepID=UPI0013D9512C|nr:hypothetical protein [Candidatus Laterigemmans baculatus]
MAATMLGQTFAVFRGDGISINAWLFLDLGLSHAAAAQLERITLVAVSVLAWVALAWPRWFLLAPAALYLLLESLAGSIVRGYAFSEWTLAAHALRYLTPVALILLAAATRRPRASSWARVSGTWLLRLGLTSVFLAHGYEAFERHPAFIDLIITSSQNLLGIRIEESQAGAVLRIIAVVDFAVALLLLVRPWRPILFWMLFWGLVTACSRMTSYGWGAYTDVLLRTTHFAIPLALLWMTRNSASRTKDEPERSTREEATA